MINSSTETEKRQVVSSLLKDVSFKNDIRNCSVKLTQRHGKALDVKLKPAKEKSQIISADIIERIHSRYKLTSNETIGIAGMIRAGTKNRKAVEPYVKEKISKRIHELDDFFEIKIFNFTKVKGTDVVNVPQYAVYCNNLGGLIEHVKEKRQVSDVHIKIGIDGGGGFLKVCLST